jgi:hypothetical protein
MTWTPETAVCVRKAWLTLGALTMPLEDPASGYFCSSLDLGSPDIRDVTSPKPDMDGLDDRSVLMGGRTVTAAITALVGAGAQIDAVASAFAPFMVPSARPVLHWVLDRPGAPERILTVRAAGYAWAVEGDNQRDIQLQWVAADPVARDPTVHTVITMAGSSTTAGRTYNLTFPRTYPPGGGSPTTGQAVTVGDVIVRPLVRVYGPITAAKVTGQGGGGATGIAYYIWNFQFVAAFTIDAGHWVDIDAQARTVYRDSDPTQPIYNQVNWSATSWPWFPPGTPCFVTIGGSTTTGVTQAQVIWQDGYLT